MDSVTVRNAYKSYGKDNVILNGLNLKMKSGTIYALIGASGCGKTTLLSSIVGIKSLDKGEVHVLGEKVEAGRIPGGGLRIGFMPQETALHEEFTVNETFYFFGNIYQMDKELLSERAEMLQKLLELPPDDQKVQDCSGGQKRRISLAVAMIHEPEILILDEPTVGIDPILRETIWKYLIDISRHKKISIIVTTHYIDEASQADRCGLMRKGVLVAQDSPSAIMDKNNCEILEEAFLKLCKSQEINQLEIDNLHDIEQNCTTSTPGTSGKKRKYFHQQTLKALIYKSYTQIARQPASMFLIFAVFIAATCFRIAIGINPSDLNIGIVNDEMLNFADCQNISPHFEGCNFNLLSCRYINEISEDYGNKKFYKKFDEAYKDAKKGKLIAVIQIASNFSSSFQTMIESESSDIDDEFLNDSEISVWLDRTDYQTSYFLQKKLTDAFKTFSDTFSMNCNISNTFGNIPVKLLKPIYGTLEINFSDYMFPMYLIGPLFFMSLLATMPVIVDDRLNGFWNRLLMTGVGTFELIFAHSVVQLSLSTIQITLNVFQLFHHFPNLSLINITPSIVIFFLTSLSGLSFGMMIGSLVDSYTLCGLLAGSLAIMIFHTSGIAWPLEGLSSFMRSLIEYLNMVTIPMSSVRENFQKGFGFSDLSVNAGMRSMTTWFILFMLGTWFTLKLKIFS